MKVGDLIEVIPANSLWYTMTPGKLYRLKNCGWYVFNCKGKLYSLEDGEIIMFIKEEPIDGVYDGTGPYANPVNKLLPDNASIVTFPE